MIPIKLISELDHSVNFALKTQDGGYFESRLVFREYTDSKYLVIYLSSASGCDQACKICHLTQTKQLMNTYATKEDYIEQFNLVLNEYINKVKEGKLPLIDKVHINFMARGEPLDNDNLINGHSELFEYFNKTLQEKIITFKILKIKISTILPISLLLKVQNNKFSKNWFSFLQHENVEIYLSTYLSGYDGNTTKLTPKSLVVKAFDCDKLYCDNNQYYHFFAKYFFNYLKNRLTIHFAFIELYNDNYTAINKLNVVIKEYNKLNVHSHKTKVNIVRFNSPIDNLRETDADQIDHLMSVIKSANSCFETPVKLIPKVGYDVKASCGMFIS